MPPNNARPDFGDQHYNMILEGHEERIRDMERGFNELTVKILPAMARLETVVTAGFDRVSDAMERGDHRFDEIEATLIIIKRGTSEDTTRDIQRDVKLAELHKIEDERKASRKLLYRSLLGVASAVVIAVIVAFLGLK